MKVVLINILGVLIGLLAIEPMVRVLYPDVRLVGTDRRLIQDNAYAASPGLRPYASGLSNGAQFQVDAYGFWKYDTGSASLDSMKASWLFLGDSVTMGIGVDPDSTFAGRIAHIVDTTNIINASLIGYTSADYVNILTALPRESFCGFIPVRGRDSFLALRPYTGCSIYHRPSDQVNHPSPP